MHDSIRKADILIEAVPYIQAFRGKVIVAKYGGSAIDNPTAMRGILQDLVFLNAVGIGAVLVHGGGPMITRRLSESGRSTRFINGMRVTDRATVRIVNQELETVNRRLVHQVVEVGGRAHGFVARHRAIRATPHPQAKQLGFVGSVKSVDVAAIRRALASRAVPVLSPIGVRNGQLYNINADSVACDVAASLRAEKLVLLTNVRGILRKPDDPASLLSTVAANDTPRLIKIGVVQSGMIPKVQACVDALRRGVKKAHIIDAGIPHAMLLEIFTKTGIGTEIVKPR